MHRVNDKHPLRALELVSDKYYRVIINDCPITVDVENHKFWMCLSLATLEKLLGRFPVSPFIGDTSLLKLSGLRHIQLGLQRQLL
jgi:hypothetical protein